MTENSHPMYNLPHHPELQHAVDSYPATSQELMNVLLWAGDEWGGAGVARVANEMMGMHVHPNIEPTTERASAEESVPGLSLLDGLAWTVRETGVSVSISINWVD